jgi:hypothetical protein
VRPHGGDGRGVDQLVRGGRVRRGHYHVVAFPHELGLGGGVRVGGEGGGGGGEQGQERGGKGGGGARAG